MEAVISIAFGVWIAISALVYRALTSAGDKGGRRK